MRIILFATVLVFSVIAAEDTIGYARGGSVKNVTVTIVRSIAAGHSIQR